MFLVGGCKNIDIALHEARTTATVLPPTEGHGRKGIDHSYEVDGHTYIGGGDPGNPPYPAGSTFEIRIRTVLADAEKLSRVRRTTTLASQFSTRTRLSSTG